MRQQQRGETGPFKGSRWSGTSGMVFWRGHCSSISGRLCKDEAYTKHYQWLLPAGDVVEAGREAVCSTLGLTSSLLCWYPIYWYAAELFHCWFLLAEEKEACWSKVVVIEAHANNEPLCSNLPWILREYCVSSWVHPEAFVQEDAGASKAAAEAGLYGIVCICISVRIRICICIHISMYMYRYCTCICICMCVCVCARVCVWDLYVYACVCMYVGRWVSR